MDRVMNQNMSVVSRQDWRRIAKTVEVWLMPALFLVCPLASGQTFNVREHGATGDGVTKDTVALQKAIDACSAASGGEVFFPKGRYLTGSLLLKSGVHLVVTPDATIVGSTSLADYPSGRLLSATEATGIGIEGGGTIDGQGTAFWERSQTYTGPPWRGTAQFEYRALKRPSFLHFLRCSDVVVKDVTLTNSPSWTLHLQRCAGAKVQRVKIRNPLYGPNTDGIDVNSCTDVLIDGCDIVTGDDGVVLKSTEPGHDHPSRNITVTNCRIWSACNTLKLGTETHDSFEHIVFRDCHLYCGSDNPLERPLSGVALESVDGAHLSDIQVSNLTMDNVRAPLFIRLGHRGGNSERTQQVEPRVPGKIEHVVIRNVTADKSLFESSITGIPGHAVQDVTLSNLTLDYAGGGEADWVTDEVVDEAVIKRYPEAQMFGRLPAYGLYCRHVDGIKLTDVRMSCHAPDPRPMLVCDDVKNLLVQGVNAATATGSFPVMWFLGVQNATVSNCIAPPGTNTFVVAEGDDDELKSLVLKDNDTRQAKQPLSLLKPGEMLAATLPVFREKSPGLVVFEAEDMQLTRPMIVHDDPILPSGKYIEVPVGNSRDLGSARCRFEVSTEGEYVVWVRGFAPSSETDSFHASIDRGPASLSDFLAQHGSWQWDLVRNRVDDKPVSGAKTVFRLAKGLHTLVLRNRESGMKIDGVVVARKELGYEPALPAKP
jgi:polygalacturonase